MNGADWIKDALIVLVAAGIFVPVLQRLGIGSVLVFLVAGMVVGPHGLPHLLPTSGSATDWLALLTVSDIEAVAPAAELGVYFLLFIIGLELSLDRLWRLKRMVLGVGALQVLLSALAIGILAHALGIGIAGSAVVGLGLSLSSTAIVMQLLIDARSLAQPVGRLSFGVLLFQDLMVVPILILIGILSNEDGSSAGLKVLESLGLAVVAVGLILLVGRFLMRPFFTLVAKSANRDAMLAFALLAAVGTALMTHAAGLSGALGAFLAGMALAETPYKHQIEADIEPFKGLFLGLFFMTVGMTIDPAVVIANWSIILMALGLLLIIKGAMFAPAALLSGVSLGVRLEAGLLLMGAGEFAFVVFTLAGQQGIFAPGVTLVLMTVAALSMALTPLLALAGARLSRVIGHKENERAFGLVTPVDTTAVVIGGFGRVGRTIARLLESEGVSYVAFDLDAERVVRERAKGRNVFYGDASRPELLLRIGADKADLFVVTPDAPAIVERMVREILASHPGARIVARARDTDHARHLLSLGVSQVVPETLEASLLLAGEALLAVGFPVENVDHRVGEARSALLARYSREKV